MSSRLTVQSLSLTYDVRDGPVVGGVSLEVAAGGCAAILGPSGSGKSSVLRMVSGLVPPTTGRVLVDDVDVTARPPERRDIVLLSQRPLLFPHLSVVDNVAFALRVRGTVRRQARLAAERYLHLVQLDGFATRRVDEISGGQAQRVALARALAAEPAVLLLDEPFSALDRGLRDEMHELVQALRTTISPTILLVTHDRDEAATLADTVVLLSAGQVMQHGSIDTLYHRPQSPQVHRLMGGHNVIPGVVDGYRHLSALGAVVLRTPPGDGPAVLMVRQEAVRFIVCDAVPSPTTATVVRCQPQGARRLVSAQLSDGLEITAEETVGEALRPGDAVRVEIDEGYAHAVPVVTDRESPGSSDVPSAGGRRAGSARSSE